ncbi:YceI family protein [Aliifodinibius salicampi]|uniref:YceI family protein n=1 Tax=Fodinibius salicampi TaxID=1920655 RepID=A0ABT3Q135_9BACT|nr:YceI family protein [Fodinibius salicampi]MCW9713829.1 YceI family protein [Fodinibius salicampi]
MKYLLTSLIMFLSVAIGNVFAQSNSVTLLEKSTMQIDGTSNVHDWTADVEQLNFDISLDQSAVEGESLQNPVTALSLTIPVEGLESGKGRMNGKMYDALKKDKNPTITFKMSSSELAKTTSDTGFMLNTSGTLTVAGTSNEISFPVEGTIQDDGTFKFTGSYEIDMNDYNVDPPTAMFGAVRSGEMVTINFELFFSVQ